MKPFEPLTPVNGELLSSVHGAGQKRVTGDSEPPKHELLFTFFCTRARKFIPGRFLFSLSLLGGGVVFPDTQLNIPELTLLFLRH